MRKIAGIERRLPAILLIGRTLPATTPNPPIGRPCGHVSVGGRAKYRATPARLSSMKSAGDGPLCQRSRYVPLADGPRRGRALVSLFALRFMPHVPLPKVNLDRDIGNLEPGLKDYQRHKQAFIQKRTEQVLQIPKIRDADARARRCGTPGAPVRHNSSKRHPPTRR